MTDPLTITVSSEGGLAAFPGLARPYTVDAARLPPEEADRLAKLVAESGFFELPDEAPPDGGADRRTYTVTVRLGDRSRTLTLSDPLPTHALRELVNAVEERRRAGGNPTDPAS